MVTGAQITAAAEVLNRYGLTISLPWEGDLDDLERERFEALKAALDAAEKAAWQPISVHPARAMTVELYCQGVNGAQTWQGQTYLITSERDIRREIGYWSGDTWRELCTGHNLFDAVAVDNHPEWLPTHWRPLPDPPTESA